MREQGLEDIQYRYEHSGCFFVHAEPLFLSDCVFSTPCLTA